MGLQPLVAACTSSDAHMLAPHTTKLLLTWLYNQLTTNLHDLFVLWHKLWLIPTTPTKPPLIYAVQTHADHCLVLLSSAFGIFIFQTKRTFGILSSDLAHHPILKRCNSPRARPGRAPVMCCRVRDHVLGLYWPGNWMCHMAKQTKLGHKRMKTRGWKFWKDLKILALFAEGIGSSFFLLGWIIARCKLF